jgi:hypothetical protein
MFRQPTAIHREQHQYLKPDKASYTYVVMKYVTVNTAYYGIKHISFKCLISVLWTAVLRY